MQTNRQNLLKSYRQVDGATARLVKMVSGNAWPLQPAAVEKLLDQGAVVEGMNIPYKIAPRHAPSNLSAMSMCIARQDIPSLEKFLDAPFLDGEGFDKDVSEAWWVAVNTQSLPALKALLARPALVQRLPPDNALSLFSNALSRDFLEGVELMIHAKMGPRVEEYEIVDRKFHRGMFAWCRSAQAVKLLVDHGASPRPPAGHEDSLSDIAQIIDLVTHKDPPEQTGAIMAVIELISLGYPLDNVTNKHHGSFASSIQGASRNIPAQAWAPLAPHVAPLLSAISSQGFFDPRGAVALLDAGFKIDLARVARKWGSWLCNSGGLHAPSLKRLLDAGMPGPAGEAWSCLNEDDEFGNDTGELDVQKCLALMDLGVVLPTPIQEQLLAANPQMKGKFAAAEAVASARSLVDKTPALSGPAVPARRM